jgi:hypothetical protein
MMALQFVEGFDALADYSERLAGYSGTDVTLDSSIVRTGSQSLKTVTSNSNEGVGFQITGDQTSIVFGCAILYTDALTGFTNQETAFLRMVTNTGSWAGWLGTTYGGNIVMGTRSGVSSYPLLGTSSSNLLRNRWNYLEFKFTVSNSTSANDLIVKINGVEVLNIVAGVDTLYSGAYIDLVYINALYNNIPTYYDDVYVLDTTGSTNNDFLGDVVVDTLYPSGNGNYSQFDGSDGNSVDNYLLVNEAQHDGDTTYVEQSGVGNRDSYTFEDMSGAIGDIHGVSVCAVVNRDDGGARTGNIFCRKSGADYDGTAFTPTASGDYAVHEEIYELEPVATGAWTESGVNASEFGIKVES